MKKEIEPRVQLFIAGLALGVLVMGVAIYVFESDPPRERGVSEWSLEIGRKVCEPFDGLVEVYPSGAVLCSNGHRYADLYEVGDALHFLSWLRSTTTANIEPNDALNCVTVGCTGVTQ